MLYYFFSYLDKMNVPGAGVFQYISFRSAMAIITSLIISLMYGKKIIQYLQKKQIGVTKFDGAWFDAGTFDSLLEASVYAKENAYPFIFARANGKDVVLAVFNPAASEKTASFSLNLKATKFTLLAGTESQIETNGNKYKLKINGQTYSLYKLSYNLID